jgi:hypothetical protein
MKERGNLCFASDLCQSERVTSLTGAKQHSSLAGRVWIFHRAVETLYKLNEDKKKDTENKECVPSR